ncbi:MAG: ABC transporter substrate-binding protein [Clostridia bacterium]|nr:ABC transporter substrate-binding protein [Clostridia bacterium]
MKKILCALLVLSMIFGIAACGGAETPPETGSPVETAPVETAAATETEEELTDTTPVRLMALQGPTGMGLASLLHNNAAGEGNLARYEAELVSSAEITNIAAAITKGECDIAAVPINLASTLFNKTEGKVQVVAANTKGVLYILENGDSVKEAADLKGKTIYATGQGSTPEYILRYVLKENGIDPDNDVTLTFVADHTELATAMASDLYAIGMLPEPNVTAVLKANESFRVALNMTEEWNKVAGEGNDLIQGVFIVRSAFAEEHPQVVKAFLKDYDESQKLVNSDPAKGAEYIVEAGILPNAGVAQTAIKGCNIVCVTGDEMKAGVSKCLSVLFDAAPASVGGALPDDTFYYGIA